MNSVSLTGLPVVAEQPVENPKLISAAHEFEASLMKEFLKPLQHDSLFADDASGDDDNTSGSAETLMSYGSEVMAKAISERGGFGIAKKIIAHLESTEKSAKTPAKKPIVRF
jgi:peptidoglycan hydrolase FlgJ